MLFKFAIPKWLFRKQPFRNYMFLNKYSNEVYMKSIFSEQLSLSVLQMLNSQLSQVELRGERMRRKKL
jgi:hypothetical protein